MKALIFLLAFGLGGMEVVADPGIAEVNRLKRAAQKALDEGRFEEAAAIYSVLVDSLGVQSPALQMNRAHAYFAAGDDRAALQQYQLLQRPDYAPSLRSMALNQIGLLSEGKVEKEVLLRFFKQALKADPSNEKARYNYQRVMQRTFDEKEKQDDQDQKDKEQEQDKDKDQKENQSKQKDKKEKGQDQQDQQQQQEHNNKEQEQQQNKEQSSEQNQEKKGQEGQKKEPQSQDKEQAEKQPTEPSTAEKLQQMNLSEEKAKQLLEALRHNEVQYLQQLRRKATRPRDDSKPDW